MYHSTDTEKQMDKDIERQLILEQQTIINKQATVLENLSNTIIEYKRILRMYEDIFERYPNEGLYNEICSLKRDI